MQNQAVSVHFKGLIFACLKFLHLFFWSLPLKRETSPAKRGDIGFGYLMILIIVLVEVSEPHTYFTEAGFPSMAQLTVVEGVLVEHPTERDSRYHTAPIGLRTATGDVFKKCSRLGVACTVEIVGNQGIGWRTYLGKPARMWFFDDSIMQLEIDGKRLEVKIPVGAKTGTKVRVANAVPTGVTGQKGDLYLVIHVADDPRYEVKGYDLRTEVTIDLYTAVLGGEVTVQTLSGNVVLTIPAGTQPGQAIRLAGRGMPRLNSTSNNGDLIAQIKVKIPRNLTARQKELFQELMRS